MPKNNRSEVRQARALAIQDIERTYQNWRALIAEKQAELQQRQALDDDDLLGTPQQAQVRKARLLPAARQELTNVLRMRQQLAQEAAESDARQAGTAAPEPDVVYEALLALISEELEGKRHPQGWALVWYEGGLHEFDYRSLRAGTNEDDYLTVSTEGALADKQQLLVGIGGLVMTLMLAAFGYWMFLYTPAVTMSGEARVTVGQHTVSLWRAKTVAIDGIEAQVSTQAGYPVRVCASADQQKAALPDATVVLTSPESVREYRIGSAQADALILDCSSSPARQVASAKLVDTYTFQASSLEIQQIEVWGPDTDPASIPSDRMVVDVTVNASDTGTLILADGTRYAATSSTAQGDHTVVRYLVPFSATPQRAGYERSGGSLPELLALDLPAPISRIALLARVLSVSQAVAAIETRDGLPTLAITITVSLAEDAAPVTLVPSDIGLVAGNSQLANASWEPPTLQPGEQRDLLLALPLPQTASLDLSLATWRARLPLR